MKWDTHTRTHTYTSYRKQDEQEKLKHRQETSTITVYTIPYTRTTCVAYSPLVFWFVLAVLYILSPGSGSGSNIATIINIEINTMILVYSTLPAVSRPPFFAAFGAYVILNTAHDVQPDLKPILRCIYESLLWTLHVCVRAYAVVHNIIRISKRVQQLGKRVWNVCACVRSMSFRSRWEALYNYIYKRTHTLHIIAM